MRSTTLWFALPALVLAGACSDTITEPVAATTPAFTMSENGQANGGGIGNAHFVEDETWCTISQEDGAVECTFQVAGLGKAGSAVVSMEGIAVAEWECGPFDRFSIRLPVDIDGFTDESGRYVGTLSKAPSYNVHCMFGAPSNVSYHMGYLMTGLAKTAKGDPTLITFTGSAIPYTPEPPPL